MDKESEMTKNSGVRKDAGQTPERLTETELQQIDGELLENASDTWCKVSRIVLTTMIERGDGVTGLPADFYRARIAGLAKEGALEARGDLGDMERSEVRLAPKH
jgi:hypothetical protein